ncbi:hypothetical protein MLD38_032705 [Melastoma candidum]|uniref:Uncharacterized protein n=1 Tax=Melastoma candidum TaxID=119954 RepID=A0ACB9M4F0_9MYRT|nr:hypothetical protein MLD38_032705 [Melastoma candidum]
MDRNHQPPAQGDHVHDNHDHDHDHCHGKAAPSSSTIIHTQARRKATGTRSWLIISESGELRTEDMEKHSIMRRTGLPARDLRVLDPILSYPSSILGRERAIVVNLEHIKAIITASEVLMVNTNSPLVFQFVQDLQRRISSSREAEHREMEDDDRARGGMTSLETDGPVQYKDSGGRSRNSGAVGGCGSRKVLPFEFGALECCLESAGRCLESETHTLEEEAYPVLDELTSKISTLNLERARQIKSRLIAISGRVQKVRDELEHLLDDDNDMAEMYLTEKLLNRSLDMSSSKEGEERPGEQSEDEESKFDTFAGSKPDVEELEMLLEAYFAQIDGILQKLSHLNEYVNDTEDCINIMLDNKQNQLLQMGVVLSCANMIINAGIVIVGLFGMNIHISLFDSTSYTKFFATVWGTVGGCIALFVVAFGWGKKRDVFSF